MEAYTTLQALLSNRIAPDLISFVQPHPPTCFHSSAIEQWVQKSLEKLGVATYTGCSLDQVQSGGVCFVKEEGEEGEEGQRKESLFIQCKVRYCAY